ACGRVDSNYTCGHVQGKSGPVCGDFLGKVRGGRDVSKWGEGIDIFGRMCRFLGLKSTCFVDVSIGRQDRTQHQARQISPLLEEETVGREKLLLHPKYLRLLGGDGNE